MIIRDATPADIEALIRVRLNVRENALSDPTRVTADDCARMFAQGGKSWVATIDDRVRGFSFADPNKRNLWALFVEQGFEGQGMGRPLHDAAVQWLFHNGAAEIWLTTGPGTRAERFYRSAGWRFAGMDAGESRFEMDRETWSASLASESMSDSPG
jgi:GNAT superfamily N-acetyltransferase